MKIKNIFITFIFFVTTSTGVFAQDAAAAGSAGGDDDVFGESMQDLSIVGGMGVVGAVIGLSTLSFVDEPSDNFRNILVGGAIGIILGVGIVAYKQATKTNETFEASSGRDFGTKERMVWHEQSFRKNESHRKSELTVMGPIWSF
jgi:hypothetical protein